MGYYERIEEIIRNQVLRGGSESCIVGVVDGLDNVLGRQKEEDGSWIGNEKRGAARTGRPPVEGYPIGLLLDLPVDDVRDLVHELVQVFAG